MALDRETTHLLLAPGPGWLGFPLLVCGGSFNSMIESDTPGAGASDSMVVFTNLSP